MFNITEISDIISSNAVLIIFDLEYLCHVGNQVGYAFHFNTTKIIYLAKKFLETLNH